MDLDRLKRTRDFASVDGHTRELIVGRKKSNEKSESRFEFGEIILHGGLPDELQDLVVDQIQNEINAIENGRRAVENYDMINTTRDDPPIQYIRRGNFAYSQAVSGLIKGREYDATTYQEPRPDIQAIRLKNEQQKPLIAFRQYTNRQVVGTSRRLRLRLRNGEYDQFEDELITLPAKIDAVYFDDLFFVFSQKQFEDGFDYLDHFQDLANDVLDDIESAPLLIENIDEFRGWVNNDRRKVRKMCQISEFGIVDELDMSIALEIIDEYGLDLEADETNGSIRVPNGHKAWELIKLLNNDHLVSPVNSERFQASGGKRRPQ